MIQPDEINNQIVTLERNVNLLLETNRFLKEQVTQLSEENQSLKESVNIKNEQLIHFKNQIKISKIAGSFIEENESATDLKKKVKHYMKQIDEIVAYLNNIESV